ncbi:MAG: GrpB family protein [Rhizobiaceae bacterium]
MKKTFKKSRDLLDYDPKWTEIFNLEKQNIRRIMGADAAEVHHIGSTSVLGMPGKNIVDILVVIENLQPGEEYIDVLGGIGYIYRPVPGREDSPFFTKPSEKPRSHNLHLAQMNSKVHRNQLLFRDYLRYCRAAFDRYAKFKRDHLAEHPDDWEGYSRNKIQIAGDLLEAAMAWDAKGRK